METLGKLEEDRRKGKLSEPVWERESGGDRGAGDRSYGGEHSGGGGVL